MKEWIDGVLDRDTLQDNLTFASLYIAIYENMSDYVRNSVKDFLTDFKVKNGKEIWTKSKDYEEKIEKRRVDGKKNRDVTKASFLWLVDNHAITMEEYHCFLHAKQIRNRYAHELTTVICQGVSEDEILTLLHIVEMYKKIVRFFFAEIEAPIAGVCLSEKDEQEEVYTMANILFEIIMSVLYRGKSSEFKAEVDKLRTRKNPPKKGGAI